MRTVLVIDDDAAIVSALRLLFELRDIQTLSADNPRAGLDSLAVSAADLVIADMNFTADTTSGAEGVVLYRAIRDRYPDLPIILLTGWGDFEAAVSLVKAGAADYVTKPWDDAKLLASVENLLELAEMAAAQAERQREDLRRRKELTERYTLGGLIFVSDSMQRVVELACRVSRAEAPVLITGPNGSGKERIAEILHANSDVKDGPWVAVNCGALPAELIEAELFGVEAGAFTGAHRTRVGRFEAADGGTIFLDEIGNLPLAGQMKLLRVIEGGKFERVGSNATRAVKVRIISATNADLPSMIREGSFRQDLYYRINVVEIAVPRLAERRADILPITESLLGPGMRLSEAARAALESYHWPGNVRELRNVLERAKLLCREALVTAEHLGLPAPVRRTRVGDDISRESIEEALKASGGTIMYAAQALGLSRQALYRRMDRLGMRP
ncbi:MAG TPA: sigma-54 dependent transcriptional regulator [Steroidobacteraceae bacterium]|jgi:DNA-binding NtrC family response regulator|nr:sigma-54 dependent transcriptional regulator [Steroidobacteraceae bacterium]